MLVELKSADIWQTFVMIIFSKKLFFDINQILLVEKYMLKFSSNCKYKL